MRLHLASSPIAVLLLAAGFPEDMAKGQPKRPAEALKATIDAAKAGDVKRFKAGLSKNFIATVERYQELGKARGELQGAFDWPIFMRSLALSSPAPKEELIQGNKATVKALHADGREVRTQMVLEDGAWKLEVPPGMVRNLDHFDDVAKMLKGEEVKLRPDLPTGGGGKADRVKNLPPDASEAEKAKAAALDAFDLGDLKGAPALLEEALEKNPGDEELVVALGRAYVQTGKGEKAALRGAPQEGREGRPRAPLPRHGVHDAKPPARRGGPIAEGHGARCHLRVAVPTRAAREGRRGHRGCGRGQARPERPPRAGEPAGFAACALSEG